MGYQSGGVCATLLPGRSDEIHRWAGHVAGGHGVLVRASVSVMCVGPRIHVNLIIASTMHVGCRVLSSVVCPRVLYRGRHVRIRHVDVRSRSRRGESLPTLIIILLPLSTPFVKRKMNLFLL